MKGIMTVSAPTSSTIFITLLLVVSLAVEISAKRGCSSFGHSCYGGHGKRSYPDILEFSILKNEGESQIHYDLGRSNDEKLAFVPLQGYNWPEQRTSNLIYERPNSNSWSLFIRKLLVPFRHSYVGSTEAKK